MYDSWWFFDKKFNYLPFFILKLDFLEKSALKDESFFSDPKILPWKWSFILLRRIGTKIQYFKRPVLKTLPLFSFSDFDGILDKHHWFKFENHPKDKKFEFPFFDLMLWHFYTTLILLFFKKWVDGGDAKKIFRKNSIFLLLFIESNSKNWIKKAEDLGNFMLRRAIIIIIILKIILER